MARSAARTCIPFCNLVMKIMILEGVSPPIDGKKMDRLRPLSMFSLQASKSHSSKALKSEPFLHAISSGQGSVMPVKVQLRCKPLAQHLHLLAIKLAGSAL